MPKIGYSYLRFSTRDQAKGHSLERQLEDTENWCKRNGVVLDKSRSLRDLGVTGFTGIHRDNPDKYALAHFVEQVQTGQIAPDCYLIIENLDRLTREDVRTATMFFLTLLELQVNIVTTSPERVYRHDSKDMIDIIAAVLELSRGHGESARKSDMVGKAWRAKKTKAVQAKAPLSAMCPHWLRAEDRRVDEFGHVSWGRYVPITGGKAYTAVSYRVFERVVLESFREVSPAELTTGDKRGEAGRVGDIKTKLMAVDEKVQTFEQRIYEDPKNDTWPRLLDQAKAEKEKLQAEYREAQRAMSVPVVEGVAEAQTLIDMVKADPSPALRKKLRAKIAAVVPKMLFGLYQLPGWRCGWVQIHFRYSDYVRNILFTHLVRRKSRNFERPEIVRVELIHEPPVKNAKFNGRLMEQLHDVSQFEALVATGDKAKIAAELDRLDEKYGIREDMVKRGYVPNTTE